MANDETRQIIGLLLTTDDKIEGTLSRGRPGTEYISRVMEDAQYRSLPIRNSTTWQTTESNRYEPISGVKNIKIIVFPG